MAIDFSKVVEFKNGVELLNCTPHPVAFLDGGELVTVEPCGATLMAKTVETPAGNRGLAALVRTTFQTSLQGEEELAEIERDTEALVLGSIISAQAYAGRVVGMIPAPGFERAASAEKRYSTEKFTTF